MRDSDAEQLFRCDVMKTLKNGRIAVRVPEEILVTIGREEVLIELIGKIGLDVRRRLISTGLVRPEPGGSSVVRITGASPRDALLTLRRYVGGPIQLLASPLWNER